MEPSLRVTVCVCYLSSTSLFWYTLEQSRTYADAGNYEVSRECLAACAKRLKALVQSSSAANDAVSVGLTQVLCDDVALALADTDRN